VRPHIARASAFFLVLSTLVAAPRALAESPGKAQRPLRYDLRIDVPVTVTAGAAWITADLLKGSLHPEQCTLCAPNALDQTVRDALHFRRGVDRAATASDVIGLYTLPVLSLGGAMLLSTRARASSPWWLAGLIFTEAVALSADVNYAAKLAVARRRPVVQARSPRQREQARGHDDNVSFYSGHTSLAFSAVAAAGTLAILHRSPYAPWVWGIGLPLAALTGYLRIAADQHYLSDVLAGASVGTAIGGLVPWLHRAHPRLPIVSRGKTPASLALTWRR